MAQPRSQRQGISSLVVRSRALRRLLTRNEIFFKTVAATALTIVSVLIGWQQMLIAQRQSVAAEKQSSLSDKQLALVDLQSRIAEATAMPNFDIKIQQILNPATNRADDYILNIDNSGGPVREFTSRAIYFVEIAITEKTIPVPPSIKFRIPINDYYAYQGITAASKGHLASISGHENNLSYSTFSRALAAATAERNWLFALTRERTFLRIDYIDILNRPHEEYYEVAPVSGSRLLSKEEGKAEFADADPFRRVSFRDLTVDKIADHIAELTKADKSERIVPALPATK